MLLSERRRLRKYIEDDGRFISKPFRSAHHESAHAVASIHGLRITRTEANVELETPLVDLIRIYRIKVIPGRPEDGPCWTGECCGPWVYALGHLHPRYLRALEWELVATMAGSVAEALYCCLRGIDSIEDFARNRGGGGIDFKRVDLLMADLCAMTKRRRVVRPYVKRTIEFLEANWHQVDALARVLVETKRIEGDRIAQVVDAAVTTKGEIQ